MKRDADDHLLAITELLDLEREGLLNADFDLLSRIAERKTKLLEVVAVDPPGKDELMKLKAAADRNSRLIDASQAGLKFAQTRIGQLREGPKSLETYGRDGSRNTLGGLSGNVERRA